MKSKIILDECGDKYWKLPNGKYHREDGPAVEDSIRKPWWVKGKMHREDGLAEEIWNGHKEWYINGLLHR